MSRDKKNGKAEKQATEPTTEQATEPTPTAAVEPVAEASAETTENQATEPPKEVEPEKEKMRSKLSRNWIPQCKTKAVFCPGDSGIVSLRRCADKSRTEAVIAEHGKTGLCAVQDTPAGLRVGLFAKHHGGDKSRTAEQKEWSAFQKVLDNHGCLER